ncbi:hypothetical protein [Halosimplex sp. TS25]|uniref:hypothetical protein n=1 Tax=Halosimplex rarum TaxID=3396619 RepID=UPI0039E87913
MTTGETEAFATRLSAAEAARVRDAVDITGLSKSDFLALAFRYYIKENPHNISAFRPKEPDQDYLVDAGILPPETTDEWTGIADL